MAVGVAGLIAATVFAEAGGLRYSYGSEGKLSYSYTLQTTNVTVGTNASVLALATLLNVGSSTVRIAPAFTVKALGPDGTPYSIHDEGCPSGGRGPFDDGDYVEIAPGASRSFTLGFGIDWGTNASADVPPLAWICEAFVLESPGPYQVRAVMSSGPLFEHTTLPVWTGFVEAPSTSFTAS
jgi:hypothetical protein